MTGQITTAKVAEGAPPMPYGYGFGVRPTPSGRIVGHNGGAPGMNGDCAILWDKGLTVMANRDPSIAEDAAQYAVDRLL
ncbi:hypothetical protein BH20VER1_BH20VER1_20060 [soil metagenome]